MQFGCFQRFDTGFLFSLGLGCRSSLTRLFSGLCLGCGATFGFLASFHFGRFAPFRFLGGLGLGSSALFRLLTCSVFRTLAGLLRRTDQRLTRDTLPGLGNHGSPSFARGHSSPCSIGRVVVFHSRQGIGPQR